MAEIDPVMFSAFERETVGILRPDLRSWALQALMARLPFESRIAARNRALVAAAEFFPPGLSSAERARQLRAALQAARRSLRPAHPDTSSLAGCLALALLARDRVPTERQLIRVLDGL